MLSYITGEVVAFTENHMILDHQGLGYEMQVSSQAAYSYQIGEEYQVPVILHLRDDGLFLYAFADEEEKEMFVLLNKVTSIGPKLAIGILSALDPRSIRLAILNNDMDALTQAPGVGKKTAGRIILELADQVEKLGPADLEEKVNPAISHSDNSRLAIEALMTLGYGKGQAEKAVAQVYHGPDQALEDMVRRALKELA